jgi:uroporphyrinogen-III synthase
VGPLLPQRCLVACLGQTTAGAAESMGLRVDAVARDTRMESLVEAVRSLLPREVAV